MRIAITGGSGFIGRHAVAAALSGGHEVHLLSRDPLLVPGATFHRCDLLDGSGAASLLAEIRPEALLHLAWYAEPGQFWKAPQNLDWVAASLQLVRSFAATGGRRLVIAGSCAEYEWCEPNLDEGTTPLKPATLYGRAKVSLFEVLTDAAPVLGLSLGWGRVFFPYGPGDRPDRLLGTLVSALRCGQPARFSAGLQRRDFIHVADVGAALVALIHSSLTGAVNIGSGKAVAVRSLIERAASLVRMPADLHFGSRTFDPSEPDLLVASTRRLNHELGYIPRFDLDAGLIDTLTAAGLPVHAD